MSVRILQSRTFARWARSEGLADSDLCRAAREIENGLVEARLDNVEDNKRKALIKLGNQSWIAMTRNERNSSKAEFCQR